MEDYFNQPLDELQKDERPELGYQVGVTLELTERPKCAVDEPCLKIIEAPKPSERPLDISAHSPVQRFCVLLSDGRCNSQIDSSHPNLFNFFPSLALVI